MIAPLTLFSLPSETSSSTVLFVEELFLTIVELITKLVVFGVVRLAVKFATTAGVVVLFLELLLLSRVVTFIIGITASVVELTAIV